MERETVMDFRSDGSEAPFSIAFLLAWEDIFDIDKLLFEAEPPPP